MKRKCLCLLSAIAVSVSMTSCIGRPDSGRDTLTIMGKESDLQKNYMQNIFNHYEKTTGNNLDIISIEDADFEIEASKRFEDGSAPDILLHFHNADLNRFDVPGNFCYLNDESWVDDLTDSARAYCQDSDGNLLGLPFWENSVSGCYYNKTLLDSLGLKPATTQTEFDSLCSALAATNYTPIFWPGTCSWMVQFGLDPLFADDPNLLEMLNKNEITYSEIPKVSDMTQWISDAASKGWLGSNYTESGWDDISPALASGEAVMTFIWDTWFYTDFKPDKYSVDDFALMPVFLNTVENGTYEGGNLNMMMVNKNSENKEKALDFLSFCATPENYNAAFDGISTVNCFKGQNTNIQSKMVTDAAASIADNERVSTAASRIIGYSGEDVASALNTLLKKKTDNAGCVKLFDDYRIAEAKKQGADGF